MSTALMAAMVTEARPKYWVRRSIFCQTAPSRGFSPSKISQAAGDVVNGASTMLMTSGEAPIPSVRPRCEPDQDNITATGGLAATFLTRNLADNLADLHGSVFTEMLHKVDPR
jgi:hypothetical protein